MPVWWPYAGAHTNSPSAATQRKSTMTEIVKNRLADFFAGNEKPWKASAIAKKLDIPKSILNKILYDHAGILWSKSDKIPPRWTRIPQSASALLSDVDSSTIEGLENTLGDVQQREKESVKQVEPTEDQIDRFFVFHQYPMAPKFVARQLGYHSSEHFRLVKKIAYELCARGALQGITGPGDTHGTFGTFITARSEPTTIDDLASFVRNFSASLSSPKHVVTESTDGVRYTVSLVLTLHGKTQIEACTPTPHPSQRSAHIQACYDMLLQIRKSKSVTQSMKQCCHRLIADGHQRRAQYTVGHAYYAGPECHFVEYKGSRTAGSPVSIASFCRSFNDHCGKFLSAVWNTLNFHNESGLLVQEYPHTNICMVFGVHDSEVIQGIAFEGSYAQVTELRKNLLDDRKRTLNSHLEKFLKPRKVADKIKFWVKVDFRMVKSARVDAAEHLYVLEVCLPLDSRPRIDTGCTWNGISYFRDGAATIQRDYKHT